MRPSRGATDAARFALRGALAALVLSGAVELCHVIAAKALFAAAEAFFIPAAQGRERRFARDPVLGVAVELGGALLGCVPPARRKLGAPAPPRLRPLKPCAGSSAP